MKIIGNKIQWVNKYTLQYMEDYDRYWIHVGGKITPVTMSPQSLAGIKPNGEGFIDAILESLVESLKNFGHLKTISEENDFRIQIGERLREEL